MTYRSAQATRLTIATAFIGATLTALAVTTSAPSALASSPGVRTDSRINIASVSVRSLALTLSPRPGTAVLTWAAPRARTRFTVMATPVKRPTAARLLKATAHSMVSFAGLEENARYVFTVTPQVGTFTGPTSRLLMTATLRQLRSLSVADQLKAVSSVSVTAPSIASATQPPLVVSPVPASSKPEVSPTGQVLPDRSAAPATSVAAPQPPRTRTVYICPEGFADLSGVCTTTLTYTYSTLAYTFHQEAYTVTVPDPPTVYAADTARSTGTLCPWGGSPNAGGDLCVIPGGTHSETRYSTVKDATPSGYTDTGTEWKKRDAAPTGYSDDGTQWVKTTAKIATEVPA